MSLRSCKLFTKFANLTTWSQRLAKWPISKFKGFRKNNNVAECCEEQTQRFVYECDKNADSRINISAECKNKQLGDVQANTGTLNNVRHAKIGIATFGFTFRYITHSQLIFHWFWFYSRSKNVLPDQDWKLSNWTSVSRLMKSSLCSSQRY